MRIAIDMDDTLLDTLGQLRQWYAQRLGQGQAPQPEPGQHLVEAVPPAHRAQVQSWFDEPGFFRHLAFKPQAREVLYALAQRHEVYIATAAMEHPNSLRDKYDWLQQHLGFLGPDRWLFCGNKRVVQADLLIDDQPRHFAEFVGESWLFAAPHNTQVTGYPVVHNWAEVAARLLN